MYTYLDSQFEAVGDPTRRAILARLLDGPLPVVEIAGSFDISRPAISQHLKILKDAKLVTDRPDGNRRLYQLNPAGFASLRDYFDRFWTDALEAFRKKREKPKEDDSWRAW